MITATGLMSRVFEPKKSKKLLRLTREALEAGATVGEVADILSPLISRTKFWLLVKEWRESGLL